MNTIWRWWSRGCVISDIKTFTRRRVRKPGAAKIEPIAIGDLLQSVLKSTPAVAKKVQQYQLWNRWAEAVGPQIATQAWPARMQGTTLVVAAKSPSWVQELSMLRNDLLRKVQMILDPTLVTDIRVELARKAK